MGHQQREQRKIRRLSSIVDQENNTWNEDSSIITNNIEWTDKVGERIKANRAATISKTKFGDYWYMVGSASKPALQECEDYKEETAGNIYIYKSKNLGSNSWEEVALITDIVNDDEKQNINAYGCVMHQHPTSEKIHLHCRTIVCVTESSSPEDFNDEDKYECRRLLDFPEDPEDPSPRRGGDGHVSFRKDDDLYFVTIRVQEPTETTGGKNGNRKLYIYKLNKEWEQIEETIASRYYDARESPQIVEHNSKYYLFTSMTRRWEWSTTHYMVSDTLEGLTTAKEEVLQTFPSNKNSFASQFSFIQNFGTDTNPQYMFAGRRHPVEDPCFMAEKWGSHIMTPMKFNEEGEPVVYWKESFDWMSKSSFDWESENNIVDEFPIGVKVQQYFKPVCDASEEELFCQYLDTCRREYRNKNIECSLASSSTNSQPSSVPLKLSSFSPSSQRLIEWDIPKLSPLPTAAPTMSAPTNATPTKNKETESNPFSNFFLQIISFFF